ncbi:hypothetical protein [uncultured Nocardioides sp.]|uniref:hypothetical protein n=1 Tax=uncultured Nocardioides sp. TaxID=198441 RepID=UPI0025D6565A|nr:hypothetical protein [uncultured Nocardioides sp.]
MTTLPSSHRRLARRVGLVVSGVAALVLTGRPAFADVPDGWSDPEPVDALGALLLLGGVPVLLFLLITLAIYLPALVRGERLAPGAAPIDDEWFGGPRPGTAELTSSAADEHETGGASAQW